MGFRYQILRHSHPMYLFWSTTNFLLPSNTKLYVLFAENIEGDLARRLFRHRVCSYTLLMLCSEMRWDPRTFVNLDNLRDRLLLPIACHNFALIIIIIPASDAALRGNILDMGSPGTLDVNTFWKKIHFRKLHPAVTLLDRTTRTCP